MDLLIQRLDGFYSRFPSLSASVKEIVAEVIPWVSGLSGLILVLMAVIDLSSSPFVSILEGAILAYLIVSAVLSLISGVLLLLSFMPLRKREIRGWRLLFIVELLFILSPVLSLHLGSIILNLILAGVGFYFLFQVRPLYR